MIGFSIEIIVSYLGSSLFGRGPLRCPNRTLSPHQQIRSDSIAARPTGQCGRSGSAQQSRTQEGGYRKQREHSVQFGFVEGTALGCAQCAETGALPPAEDRRNRKYVSRECTALCQILGRLSRSLCLRAKSGLRMSVSAG